MESESGKVLCTSRPSCENEKREYGHVFSRHNPCFPEGAADQVFYPFLQRVLLFRFKVAQVPDIHRHVQVVAGFRHGKTLHIVTVAVVALRVDVVINRVNKRLRRYPAIQQQIRVRCTRTTWRVMQKKIRSMLSPATLAIIER